MELRLSVSKNITENIEIVQNDFLIVNYITIIIYNGIYSLV